MLFGDFNAKVGGGRNTVVAEPSALNQRSFNVTPEGQQLGQPQMRVTVIRSTVWVQPGATFLMDQNLLCGKFRTRLKTLKRTKTLKNLTPELLGRARYNIEVSNRVDALLFESEEAEHDMLWTKAKHHIMEAAEATVGRNRTSITETFDLRKHSTRDRSEG